MPGFHGLNSDHQACQAGAVYIIERDLLPHLLTSFAIRLPPATCSVVTCPLHPFSPFSISVPHELRLLILIATFILITNSHSGKKWFLKLLRFCCMASGVSVLMAQRALFFSPVHVGVLLSTGQKGCTVCPCVTQQSFPSLSPSLCTEFSESLLLSLWKSKHVFRICPNRCSKH